MTRLHTFRLASMGALGALALIFSVGGLLSLNGGGALRLGDVDVLPVAAGYDRQAQAALAAPSPGPSSLADSASRTRAAIAQYPYDTGAWLRLAYVDSLEHGRLTPAGVAALQHSYDLVGVDPDFAIWRISFALEHIDRLPPPLLQAVGQEVATIWTVGGYRRQLNNLRTELNNPAGRLALLLWINDAQRRDGKTPHPAANSRTP